MKKPYTDFLLGFIVSFAVWMLLWFAQEVTPVNPAVKLAIDVLSFVFTMPVEGFNSILRSLGIYYSATHSYPIWIFNCILWGLIDVSAGILARHYQNWVSNRTAKGMPV